MKNFIGYERTYNASSVGLFCSQPDSAPQIGGTRWLSEEIGSKL